MSDTGNSRSIAAEIEALQQHFSAGVTEVREGLDCPVVYLDKGVLVEACLMLRDQQGYEELIDICGVDMLHYPGQAVDVPRFEVVYQLLSVANNKRLRLKVRLNDRELIDSVVEVWPTANWFEREAFEMYGVIFNHHPDLRRLLTDYGFEGHPMRKDFPCVGRAELFFDEQQWRCVYKPNQVENRELIPKTWPGVDRG